MARPYGGRTAQERKVERRERMLQAGIERFGSDGYRATSIEALCAAAGVSTRNFYEEFGGREALLVALHDRVTGVAFAAAAAALDAAGDVATPERLGAAITAYLDAACADPRWARIAFVEVLGVGPEVEEHRLAWRDRLGAFLTTETARAVARGEAADRDHSLTVIAFFGAVNELVYEWTVRGRTVPLHDIATELTRLAVAALAAP